MEEENKVTISDQKIVHALFKNTGLMEELVSKLAVELTKTTAFRNMVTHEIYAQVHQRDKAAVTPFLVKEALEEILARYGDD